MRDTFARMIAASTVRPPVALVPPSTRTHSRRPMAQSLKANAVWQWHNYLCSRVPVDKQILNVNMDETSVCMVQGTGAGNIFADKADRITQNFPTAMQRTNVTHVAFICDNAEVQHLMPQVIIANEHTITDREMFALRAASPRNVRILRRRSAWVDAEICALFMFWLVLGLGALRNRFQIVLLFDAYKAHFGDSVMTACAAHGIWPILIPASLTWLLQPLDTHAFLPYKLCLQRAYQVARMQTHNGVVGIHDLFACVYFAIADVLENRSWSSAFVRDGFGEQQSQLSSRVESWLELSGRVAVGEDRISDRQLRACFPRRTVAGVQNIWRPLEAFEARVLASHVVSESRGAAGAVSSLDSGSHTDATIAASSHVGRASAASSSSRLPVGSPLVTVARRFPTGTRLLHGRPRSSSSAHVAPRDDC